MNPLLPSIDFDKPQLAEKILSCFKKQEEYLYKRNLIEVFDKNNKFIGDNLVETIFHVKKDGPPVVYEISGPYDATSKEYATCARVYYQGELIFEFDMKRAILQRTASMVLLYLDYLEHDHGNILIWGAGKLATHIVSHLKYFNPQLTSIDYIDLRSPNKVFEDELDKINIIARNTPLPNLNNYSTIILATNTSECIIDQKNITLLQPGTTVVSLCTSSQRGEVSKEIYASDVNIFMDYELTRTFTEDMRIAKEYTKNAIMFLDVLSEKTRNDIKTKINIIRLTGTPYQNVAVIDMMMKRNEVRIGNK